MNLNLNYEGFEQNLVKRGEAWCGGVHYLFKFDNRHGASIIKHQYSRGFEEDLWELAVIWWRDDEWELDYDTPIAAGDTIGYLTDEDVRDLLQQIKDL